MPFVVTTISLEILSKKVSLEILVSEARYSRLCIRRIMRIILLQTSDTELLRDSVFTAKQFALLIMNQRQ